MKFFKKLISGIITVSILISLCPCITFAAEGTEANPYLISTPDDLLNVRNDLTAYYKLACDIDMAGVEFTPIGNEDDGAFNGTLDGAGYKIKNLTAGDENTKYAGLIGYLEGTVKNITLDNVNVSGYRYVGGIAGYIGLDGVIDACKTEGSVNGNGQVTDVNIGMIAGACDGYINNSINYGTCKSSVPNWDIGQFVGCITGVNNGIVSDTKNYGLIDCPIFSWGLGLGGISGVNYGTIRNCNNSGILDSSNRLGGICGNNFGIIYYCTNFSEITSEELCGGIVAESENGEISFCRNYGNVSSSGQVIIGGIAGTCNYTNIYSCINASNVSSIWGGAGIVGKAPYSRINMCENSGKISCTAGTGNGAGVVYDNDHTTITNCLNKGYVIGNGSGGITNTNDYGAISSCINTGVISGNTCIIHGHYNTSINDCYALDYFDGTIKYGNVLDFVQMKFLDKMNLNFEKIWDIDSRTDSGLPQLRDLPEHIDLSHSIVFVGAKEQIELQAYINKEIEDVVWNSDDKNVATVSSDGIVTAKGVGVCTITATNLEGIKANCLIYVHNPVLNLSFNDSVINITKGNTDTLTPVKNPMDANENIMWDSNNESVVKVDNTGKITAISKGQATITATSVTGDVSAFCVVNVDSPAQSISLSSTSLTLNVDEIKRLTATISPSEYTGTIKWSSSNEDVATVDNNGLITAKSPGTAIISVSSDSGKTAQCTLTVKSPATAIELSKNEITVTKGYTYKISASMLPSNTTDTITWTTSSSHYATVSTDGTISAYNIGTATITATTTSGQKAYCVVNIVNPDIPVASVTLDKTEHIMTKSETVQLKGTVLPNDASNKDLTWSTSDETIASVNEDGVVTANSVGVTTITVTANNGMYHECIIKVVSASGPSIVLTPENAIPNAISKVKASIVRNPGISGYKFTINYNDMLLTPISVTANEEFGGALTTNLDDANRTEFNVVWYSNGDTDIDINGELFTIDFKVAETAELGDYSDISIEYGAKDICNTAGENIALYTESAKLTIEELLAGDIYEDGDVNIYDLTLLARHMIGLADFTDRQMEAANVTDDDLVDIKDVVKLAQYVVGWTGIELMSLMSLDADVPKTPTVTVGTASVNDANEADIPVYIKNNTGIAAYRFVLDYNADDIEIVSITPSDFINSKNFGTNLGQENDEGLIVFCYQEGNAVTDGELFTVKVRYKNPTGTSISPISIKSAENNFCNQAIENVALNYETGYVLGDDYIVTNKVVGDTNFSCELYFDDSYAEQTAKAIITFYNEDGELVQIAYEDTTINPGKIDVDISYDKTEYYACKFMIWNNMHQLTPLTQVE